MEEKAKESGEAVAASSIPPFSPIRVILIGLGGIGSKLADELARYMSYEAKAPKELILVDGDVYSQSNLDRQSVLESDVGRPKAQVWAEGLAAEFRKLAVTGLSGYVVPVTVKKDNTVPISKLSMEGAVTVLAVDNHKTRKMFSDHFQKEVENGVLVNGGNNMTDGSLITAVRIAGDQVTPPIDAFHPEIADPKDKNPGELSCAELAKIEGGTQVIWANQMVAAMIGNEFHCIVQGEWEKLRARGEVYFDIMANAAIPRRRFVSGKEVEDEGKEAKVAEKSPGKSAKHAKGKKPSGNHGELKIVDDRDSHGSHSKASVKSAAKALKEAGEPKE